VKLGHVAIDGTKQQANASKHKAMSYDRMEEKEKQLTRRTTGAHNLCHDRFRLVQHRAMLLHPRRQDARSRRSISTRIPLSLLVFHPDRLLEGYLRWARISPDLLLSVAQLQEPKRHGNLGSK
jgi:hypothetical protein